MTNENNESNGIDAQATFGADGDLETPEHVESDLEHFGADVDTRERETAIDRPTADVFGCDDRADIENDADPGEQSAIGSETDENQRDLTGDPATKTPDWVERDRARSTTHAVETDEGMDLPENEPIRLIQGIVGVMHSPTIVDGVTSSTGKTITVDEEHGTSTHRLDTETILSGESEYRDSTSFEIYTPGRLIAKQRSNHAPGPQAGSSRVADPENLPDPTHWPATDEPAEAPEECPNCGQSPGQWQDVGRPRCERCGETHDPDEKDEETDPVDSSDKWDLDDIGRGSVLALEKYRGDWLVVGQKRLQHGTVVGLDVVGPDDQLLRLRKVDFDGYHFDARPAERGPGGQIREKDGESPFRNVDDMDDVRDFEVIGEDTDALQRWIRDHFDDRDGDDDGGMTVSA